MYESQASEPDMGDMFEIRETADKGKGLFATQRIPKGTLILSEVPLYTSPDSITPEDLCYEVTRLPNDQQKKLRELYTNRPYTSTAQWYRGICMTNSFNVDGDIKVAYKASRINHSCNSNSTRSWDEPSDEVMIHAWRDIEEGDKITTNYINSGLTKAERQESLQRVHKFECVCDLCSLSAEESTALDLKFLRIRKLWTFLQKDDHNVHERHLKNPLLRLRHLEEIADHRKSFGSAYELYLTYLEAAALVLAHGDVARGKVLMRRAYDVSVLGFGVHNKNAEECQRRLADVRKCGCYGKTTRWTTKEDDIHPHSNPDVFENWLWKKQTDPLNTTPYTDLFDRVTFPGVRGLPEKKAYDMKYNQYWIHLPRRHWCFIGEIITVSGSDELLQLTVKDVDDYDTRVFYELKKIENTRPQKDFRKAVQDSNPDAVRSESVNPAVAKTFSNNAESYGKDKNSKHSKSQVENSPGEDESKEYKNANSGTRMLEFGKGDTVLILYPEREECRGKPFIRVRDTSKSKVRVPNTLIVPHKTKLYQFLPFSPEEIVYTSTGLREYATEADGKRICHGCDRPGDPPLMSQCGACKLIWYCDKVSHTIHVVHGVSK